MKVLKFGGSSISTANHIKNVCHIITDDKPKIVVFSAVFESTNLLSQLIDQLHEANWIKADTILTILKEKHLLIIESLFTSNNFKQIAVKKLNDTALTISKYFEKKINEKTEGIILAQGEQISSMIIYLYLLEQGNDAALIPALNYLKLTKDHDPDYEYITRNLNKELNKHKGCRLFITQGFICINHKHQITNLNRGGSDYTSTIIARSLNLESVEIWTDINGLQNNDPRFVQNTKTIHYLSYEEASELAFFGAKILHPLTLKPLQHSNIPLTIKNTYLPESTGTSICNRERTNNLKAVASKDRITCIKVRSGKMMQAYGFLRKIFEVFEKYQTSVDMLTTSEISVAMTIENKKYLTEIVQELELIGEVEVESNQSIICIVQDYFTNPNQSIQEIISALQNIPVKMITYGSSNINCSLIIDTANKAEAMNLLNHDVLKNEACLAEN